MFRRVPDWPINSGPSEQRSDVNKSSSLSTTTDESLHSASLPAKQICLGICVENTLLYIRAFYRTAELVDRWDGGIIRTQTLFVIFDRIMVLLTLLLLNVYHPGRLLMTPVMTPLTSSNRTESE
ncbi:hypothetical protein C8Q78DRAFT_717978 [Trametes maxima]|nr:hypothetical protein C8Q78DRAFT_717978 [Trametes maxima]